jgi:2-oxoglutarate ferredoxin oxidoreductase subunit delta
MVHTLRKERGIVAVRAFRVTVDAETCDGCGVCIFYCKPAVFAQSRSLNRRGFYPAAVVRAEACNDCRLCEVACPQLSIEVTPQEGAA